MDDVELVFETVDIVAECPCIGHRIGTLVCQEVVLGRCIGLECVGVELIDRAFVEFFVWCAV